MFYRLKELQPGQTVQVRRADDSAAKFAVAGSSGSARTTSPTREVYGRVDRPELRLITCGGPSTTGPGYRDNIVVFAHLV